MKLSQFKFKLPEEKIALHPTKYRDESRLMVLHRKTGEIEHKEFKDVLHNAGCYGKALLTSRVSMPSLKWCRKISTRYNIA